MATRNSEIKKAPRTGKKPPASPDSLVKGGKNAAVELSEDDLKNVSGGGWSQVGNTKY